MNIFYCWTSIKGIGGMLFYYSLLYLVLWSKICPYPHVDMNSPTIVTCTCNETFVFRHEKIIFHRSDMVVCLRRTILIIFSYYFYLVCKWNLVKICQIFVKVTNKRAISTNLYRFEKVSCKWIVEVKVK